MSLFVVAESPRHICSATRKVLAVTDVLESRDVIPSQVDWLLRRYPLVLAGGAVVGMLSPTLAEGSDYDLFVHSLDEAGADALLEDIHRELPEPEWRRIVSSQAWTFIHHEDNLIIQIILRLYDRPEQVPLSFDLAPCKVALHYSKPTLHETKRVIQCSSTFLSAMRQGGFPTDVESWSDSSVSRVLKYCSKGLDAYLPGLRRPFVASRTFAAYRGVAGLIFAEQRLGTKTRPCMGSRMSRVIKALRGRNHGYEECRGRYTLYNALKGLFDMTMLGQYNNYLYHETHPCIQCII